MVPGDNNGLGEGWAWAWAIDLCLCTYYRLSTRLCQPTKRGSLLVSRDDIRGGGFRKRGKRTKPLPHPRATTTLARFLDQRPALILGRPACGASCGLRAGSS